MKFSPYPRYKPSGVAWLGDVPEDWKIERLKYSASINDEVLVESSDPSLPISYVDISSVDATRGIVSVEDMTFEDAPSRARRVVRHGDTIVSTVRTYLRAIAAVRNPDPNTIVSTGFAVIRPRRMNPAFMSYALKEAGFVEAIVARSVGVSYPAVNASEIGALPIPLPGPDEQRAIADFLDRETAKIDALVAKKRTLIERLKEKRTALISRTVTRGLPPDAARAAGLDPHPKLKSSGVDWLGDVPEHWPVLPLKYLVITPVTDGPHETPEILDEGIPFVSAEAIGDGRISFERIRGHISLEDHRRYSKKYKPKRGDIYMVKSGATTGRVAIVRTDREFNIWSPLAAVRCNIDQVDREFLFTYMQSPEFQSGVALSWSFGTQQNISMNVLENLRVPLPPLNEQRALAGFLQLEIGPIDAVVSRVTVAIERLQERRMALITAAVTGKIDLREAAA